MLKFFVPSSMYFLVQGEARRYGRITNFLPLPTWGHDLPWAIVTQALGIFQMDIIFPEIHFFLLYVVKWFGLIALSKSSTFHFSKNQNSYLVLKTYF